MTPWGSPARGAPDDSDPPRLLPPQGHAVPWGRSAFAPVVLAATTVAGVAGAVLALLPAAIRRRPVGRPVLRRAEEGAASDAASEPLVP